MAVGNPALRQPQTDHNDKDNAGYDDQSHTSVPLETVKRHRV
jgi:hypothetical protein